MIETSKKYKKAIYAPTRYCKGKVRFEILDKSAFEDNILNVSDECIISRKDQVTNKIRVQSEKYATLEKDYFKLDSSFIIPPKPMDLINYEVGYWSESLSDSTETLLDPVQLQFTFSNNHSSVGLTISFDILNNEYAKDFSIAVYDSSDNIIINEVITDNDNMIYSYIKNMENYKKIIISITKWCKPYRRVKITEVDFGIIEEYTDDRLINMSVLQEVNSTSKTLPSDELSFTIDNSKRLFNLLNPKGFYRFLEQGQECYVDLGLATDKDLIEYVRVGKYYLNNWKSEEGSLKASFTAREIFSFLNTEVNNSAERNITLYTLVEEILTNNNIDNYRISDNLKTIYTKGLYNKKTYRELLRMVAEASCSIIYTDNEGYINITQLIDAGTVIDSIIVSNELDISSKDQIVNNILTTSFNIVTLEKNRFKLDGNFNIPSLDMGLYEVGWISNDICNNDGEFNDLIVTINIFQEHSSKTLEIIFDENNQEYAEEFILYAYDKDDNEVINETITNTQSRFNYINNSLINTRKIIIDINKWSEGNRRARIVEIGFDLPTDNLTFDNIYSPPKIDIKEPIKLVEVEYYTDLDTKQTYTLESSNVKKGQVLKINNTLINSLNDAMRVGEWILKESNQTAIFKSTWRQNPSITLGDKISIQSFDNNNNAIVTKQEYKYEGYLKGSTEARGVV